MISASAPGEALVRPAPELARHLERCPSCALEARADRRLVADLAAMRGSVPFTIDVRQRVRLELERLGPVPRHEVSVLELALAAMTAIGGLGGLVVVLWQLGPTLTASFPAVASLARVGSGLLTSAWSVMRMVLSIPLRLAVMLSEGASTLAPLFGALEGFAVVAIAAGYLLMTFTIVHFVGRDLRVRRATHGNGE